MRLIGETNIDFLSKRKFTFLLSGLVITVGIISLFIRGEANLGIDFTGGSLVQLKFEQRVSTEAVRAHLSEIDLGKSIIQLFDDGRGAIIRASGDVGKEIIDKLDGAFLENRFEVKRREMVGPTMGKDLRRNAILALLFALIGILIYISYRFEFRFAVAAIIALFHDVLITVGLLSLTGRELSMPVFAALLTIVGYSLNDTIVVFDRIRENIKFMTRDDYQTIINFSINQTLSRTILTSFTTFIVVLLLYLLGGVVIQDFAFALVVGVIVGTYSSIFVASPILIEWQLNKARTYGAKRT